MSDDTEDIESAVVKEYGYQVYAFYYVSAQGEPLNCQFESERDAWQAAVAMAKEDMEPNEWNARIEAQKAKGVQQ